MKKNKLSVHSENILPIIKKWLYSDKDIFLRELVSNACDALNKAKILVKEGLIAAEDAEFKIFIQVDKAAKTIVIADTGIGMTEEEVEKYIAQIAFSGATEFVGKYSAQTDADPIIGHFGLGFYSAYMVASSVDIQTLSYQPAATPVLWKCDGSSEYDIGAGNKTVRGTEITLHIDDESLDVLEESKLRELLNRYCRFLPFPIELNGESIGNQTPLWQKNQTTDAVSDQACLEFYRGLYPLEPEPIFWIHLQIDYPFNLKGILYFPKMHRRFDANQSAIQLFCNRVFVSDNCKDILPDYLTVLRGAIDCPDIPLNVSRSSLQVDKNVRQLSSHISKKVSDRLTSLYKTDREKFIACWPDVEMVVKLGILQDEKFYDRIKDVLIWENSEGVFTTANEYIERNPTGKILYATHDRSGAILEAYKEKKAEFIYANAPIDIAVIQYLEDKLSTQFQRIDGAIDGALTDASREKTVLDENGKSESARMADSFRTALNPDQNQNKYQDGIAIEAKSLSSDNLPAFIVLDENERRFRDYLMMTQGKGANHLLSKKTLVINTNSKLVQTIVKLQGSKPELATDLAKHILDLSLLAQKELDPAETPRVLARQSTILEKLAELVVG
jgi:molecular chaperone HtpG